MTAHRNCAPLCTGTTHATDCPVAHAAEARAWHAEEDRLRARVAELEDIAGSADKHAGIAEDQATAAEQRATAAETRAVESRGRADLAITARDTALARATAAEARAETLRAVLNALLYSPQVICRPPGDWACAECRPESDILRQGFRCAYHAALALVRAPTPGEALRPDAPVVRDAVAAPQAAAQTEQPAGIDGQSPTQEGAPCEQGRESRPTAAEPEHRPASAPASQPATAQAKECGPGCAGTCSNFAHTLSPHRWFMACPGWICSVHGKEARDAR